MEELNLETSSESEAEDICLPETPLSLDFYSQEPLDPEEIVTFYSQLSQLAPEEVNQPNCSAEVFSRKIFESSSESEAQDIWIPESPLSLDFYSQEPLDPEEIDICSSDFE